MGLNPAEKAAIEAERRKSAAVRRWYPESPFEGEEEKELSPEERRPHVIDWLKEDVLSEFSDSKKYWIQARWAEKMGEPEIAEELRKIMEDEETHKNRIESLLRKLGETV